VSWEEFFLLCRGREKENATGMALGGLFRGAHLLLVSVPMYKLVASICRVCARSELFHVRYSAVNYASMVD
jgi:hypothetical protein